MQLEHKSLQHKMKALVIEPFTIEEVATEEIGRGATAEVYYAVAAMETDK